jgi:hypothetical protein
MGLMDRVRRLDERAAARFGPRNGESRRDYIERRGRNPLMRYENPHVYREIVELHDRVAELEAQVAALQERGNSA